MNSSDKAKKLYNLYYSAKSTGFIVPILYLYLQDIMGLQTYQVLLIAAGYNLLPFIFEVPLGYLGDKFGNKRIVMSGIVAQAFAFGFLLLFKDTRGYHFYLLFSCFAGAAYSGAETSIIRAHFKTDEGSQFRSYFLDVSVKFYRNTIAFLIIGVVGYHFFHWLPLALQVISFFIAFYLMSQIEDLTYDKHAHNSLLALKNENMQVVKFVFKNNRFLGMVLIDAIFSSSVLINHKTIQQTLSNSLKFEPYIILGIIYVAGNIVSYKGSKFFQKKFFEKLAVKSQLLLFGLMMTMSFLLMSTPSFILISGGFLLICLFKALYRPVISSELSSNVLLVRFHSTILSYVSVLTAAFSAFVHFAIAPFFKDYFWGNISFILISIIPFFLGYYLYSKKSNFFFTTETNPLTKKRNVIKVLNEEVSFLQYYPGSFPVGHFKNLEINISKSRLVSPSKFIFNHQEQYITCDYLGDKNLSRLSHADQFKICSEILKDVNENKNKIREANSAYYPPAESIFNIELSSTLRKEIFENPVEGLLHGDLHPLNIMIVNDSYVAIDWDNSGYGPLWFDVLTLLTSPYLSLTLHERMLLLEGFFTNLNKEDCQFLIHEFSLFKANQMKKFEYGDGFYISLSSKYFLMIKSFAT